MKRRGFSVIKTNCPAPDDSRGRLWQWKFEDGRQITVCERKAGSIAGCHVHYGDDESKNPERLFFARGKAKVTFLVKGPDNTERKEEITVEAGDSITIQPHTQHKIEVLEDAVILEYRITHFDKHNPDTVNVEL